MTLKWLNRLRATSNNNESREQHSQLASLLDYYNKPHDGASKLAAIQWDSYRSNIHTDGVVDKIKDKYESFMASEFDVAGAVGQTGQRSEARKNLDVTMQYNYNLWMVHYLFHLEQIETLHNIGDTNELSRMEMTELFPAAEVYTSTQ